ncbi:MAG: MATE family efflux transporter [Paludibacteraceae bacterium]|nr:MATE family efflux transporter [Paludibacteraceae bacterium]
MSSSTDTLKLGTEPIGKLLRQYALPAIIAMTASSLYNIVDSVFIGHGVGPLALSGITVAKPFMDICAAFGSLVGVGASTLVSIKLGQQDYESARRVLGNVIVLNILLSLVVTIAGLLFLDPILLAFGASGQTLSYARDYMIPILVGNVLTHIYFGLNNVLRASGHPKSSMTATIVAVVINIALDPIFIFLFDMGVRGAALATMISQAVAVAWQFTIFCNPKELLHFNRRMWHLDSKIVLDSFAIGLSPFLMNIAHSVVVIVINNQLKTYGGDLAIASYGVINRLTFVFAMIVMGLNQGMQPIAGYNYGARHYDRMLAVFRLTAICATMVTTLVFLLSEICPSLMVAMFTHDEQLTAMSVPAMQIVLCMFFCTGFQMVTGNFFTSIGMAGKAIFLSLTRQVLYLIPLVCVLPIFMGLNGVWAALPASDAISALTAAVMLVVQIRNFKRMHKEHINNQY